MQNEWIRHIAAAGLLSLAALAPTEGLITGVSKHNIPRGVEISIKGSGLSNPREISVMHGTSYILEFNAKLAGRSQFLSVFHGGVSEVKAGWYSARPAKVHVLVKMAEGEHTNLVGDEAGYTLTLTKDKIVAKGNDDLPPVDTSMLASTAAAPKAKKHAHTVTTTEAVAKEPYVSLDFVNTDVVQIIKALALQSGVNIVTAPEVAGKKISVSLEHVKVADALDFVTALAGLRYARVQDSYIVTTRERFGAIMTDLADRTKAQNVIRIVPIVSGDGNGIKNALSRWFGPTSLQVVLPSDPGADKVAAGASAPGAPDAGGANGQAAGAAGGGAAAGNPPVQAGAAPADAAAKPDTATKDGATPYLMLIGEQKWVKQAENLVRKLDADIMEARSATTIAQRHVQEDQAHEQAFYTEQMANAKSAGATQEVYEVRNGLADDLKKAMAGQSFYDAVNVVASPLKSKKQVLIVSGQPATVKATIDMLKQLDTGSMIGDEVFMYDIKYVDPRSLREDVLGNVPGIIVTNPPASAGTPRLYQSGLLGSQTQSNTGLPSTTGGGAATGPQSGAAGVKGDTGQITGIAQPFQDDETAALPMRLLLRGSHSQIEQALAYIRKVDVRPKQLAIDMRVMELSKEDAIKLGINWSIFTGGAVKTINLANGQGGIGGNGSPANSVGIHLGGSTGGNNFGADVTATLDAISNKNNLISRPNLMAMDGRESEIFVGDDVRYIVSIQATQNGTTVQTGDVPVGVRLSVLPRIGGDGSITMDLRPVVSFLKGFTDVPGGGKLPQTSLRISQNTVNVHSGETIAIGGLIQDQDVFNLQKVPFLGDLPFFGQFFRSTTHDRTRTEVVFFLTVREITEDDRRNAADPRASESANPPELGIPARKVFK